MLDGRIYDSRIELMRSKNQDVPLIIFVSETGINNTNCYDSSSGAICKFIFLLFYYLFYYFNFIFIILILKSIEILHMLLLLKQQEI
jgi:hypothetical protein